MPADRTKRGSEKKTKNGNTWITGVISDQNGKTIRDDIRIVIRSQGKKVAEIKSHKGMFRFDAKDLLDPGSKLLIKVPWQAKGEGKWGQQRYEDCKVTVNLADAQNVNLALRVQGGRGYRPVNLPPKRCVRTYINDI